MENDNHDNFRAGFKFYRQNVQKNDNVKKSKILVDLEKSLEQIAVSLPLKDYYEGDASHLGLSPPKLWRVFAVSKAPGLILVKGCLTSEGQLHWASKCISEYPLSPNKTNVGLLDNCVSLTNLRWVTLGYHHNWDTKVYTEESRSPFPSDLKELSEAIAAILGFSSFKAEAAIVNYYHMSSSLSGHTDHSEVNKEAPLMSISLGQSAVFLIGGKTKDIVPLPMILESGDLLIMSGESRLCYHAVPRIFSDEKRTWLSGDSYTKTREYLQNNRINVNIRQVNH